MSGPQKAKYLSSCINDGITALGMSADKFPVASYVSYLELLNKWNKAYNLTAINDMERMVPYHILDSLSVLPYIKGELCIDIGTGAGLPGLILALATPEKQWVLLDSNQKKMRFVKQAILDLDVKNVVTERHRTEEFRPDKLFSAIIARAYGSLGLICDQSRTLLAPGGSIYALKGAVSKEELAEIDKSTHKVLLHELRVPGITERRTLVEISPLPSTN